MEAAGGHARRRQRRGDLDNGSLRGRGIGYVALFGSPDVNKARYWGRPIIALFLERLWQPWLGYSDPHLKVYRIPETGTPGRLKG